MMNSKSKNWYVLYTKPRWERRIAGRLTDLGMESYCPLNRVERKWSDRRKVIFEPLFKNYVFVRLDPEDFIKPLEISGVFRYVCRLKKPAPVRDSEIEAVRRFLSEYRSVKLEKINVGVNDAIEILYGPFMEKTGKVTQVNDNYVKVMIRSLGYSLVATVSRSGIRKLETIST